MTISLPQPNDPLNIPDHALSHRVFAHDTAAPEQSVVVDSSGLTTVNSVVERNPTLIKADILYGYGDMMYGDWSLPVLQNGTVYSSYGMFWSTIDINETLPFPSSEVVTQPNNFIIIFQTGIFAGQRFNITAVGNGTSPNGKDFIQADNGGFPGFPSNGDVFTIYKIYPRRLAIGTSNQVLSVINGTPTWSTISNNSDLINHFVKLDQTTPQLITNNTMPGGGIEFMNGTYAINALGGAHFDSSNTTADLALYNNYGGRFTDPTNTVTLCNGTHAIDTTGSININGDITGLSGYFSNISVYANTHTLNQDGSASFAAGQAGINTGGRINGIGLYSKSFTVTNPTMLSSTPIIRMSESFTIVAVHVLCIGGTSIDGALDILDYTGGNPGPITTDFTAYADTNLDINSFASPSAGGGNYLGFHITSVVGQPQKVVITFEYTIS